MFTDFAIFVTNRINNQTLRSVTNKREVLGFDIVDLVAPLITFCSTPTQ